MVEALVCKTSLSGFESRRYLQFSMYKLSFPPPNWANVLGSFQGAASPVPPIGGPVRREDRGPCLLKRCGNAVQNFPSFRPLSVDSFRAIPSAFVGLPVRPKIRLTPARCR